MKTLFTILVFVFGVTINAQQWAVSAGGSNGDMGYSICTDQSGNIYITGYFISSISFGSTTLTSYVSGDYCIYIAKYSSAGVFQWARRCGNYTGTTSCNARAIKCDASGDVYVSGTWGFDAIFGSDTLTSNYGNNIFVSKLNSSGDWQWTFSGIGQTTRAIVLDGSGNYYVTGSYSNFATFGATTLNSSSTSDAFIAKGNSSGWIWAVSSSGSGSHNGTGIGVDASSNVYVAGTFSATTTYGSLSVTCNGSNDIYVAKLNSSGTPQWLQSAGAAGSDVTQGLATDAAGNTYITGQFANTVSFGAYSVTSSSGVDSYVAKYNSSGTAQWAIAGDNSSGGTGSGFGVACDASGGVSVCGGFNTGVVFGSYSLTSAGSNDIFVLRLNSSGTILNALRCGGSGSDVAQSIAMDASSNQYLTGYFNSTATFGSTQLTSAGDIDVFVTKIAAPTPGVTLTNPASGQSYCVGSTMSIQWTSTSVNNVNIKISSDGGSSFNQITSTSSQNGTNSYSFALPGSMSAGSAYKIKVESTTDASLSSTSGTFNIVAIASISTQPGPPSQSACVGSAWTISLVATGASLTYQWRKDGVALSGATTSTLTYSSLSANQSGTYDCVVGSLCGTPSTSSSVVLNVMPLTAMTFEPQNQSGCAGQSIGFSLTAAGSSLSYQWKHNGSVIPGATQSNYVVSSAQSADSGTYVCVITGACGSAVSSATVHMSVAGSLTFVQHPTPQTVCATKTATFSTQLQGLYQPSYEWLKNGVSISDNARISGSNTSTLSVKDLQVSDMGTYTVRVSQCGIMQESNAALLTVLPQVQITGQPQAQLVPANHSATFSVAALGSSLRYQWQYNGVAIKGATTARYTIDTVTKSDEGQYTVVVSGECNSVVSNSAQLTLSDIPIAVCQLSSYDLYCGIRIVGISDTTTLRISNTGTARLDLHSVVISGPDSNAFSTSFVPKQLEPAQSYEIFVLFKPTHTGTQRGSLTISSNASSDVHTEVHGIGIHPEILSSSFQLKVAELNNAVDSVLRVCNLSGVDLTITKVSLLGDIAHFSFNGKSPDERMPILVAVGNCFDLDVHHASNVAGVDHLYLIMETSVGTDTVEIAAESTEAMSVLQDDGSSLLLHPQPADDVVYLTHATDRSLNWLSCFQWQSAVLSIVDQLGIRRCQARLDTSNAIRVDTLPSGQYIVIVESGSKYISRPLLINR